MLAFCAVAVLHLARRALYEENACCRTLRAKQIYFRHGLYRTATLCSNTLTHSYTPQLSLNSSEGHKSPHHAAHATDVYIKLNTIGSSNDITAKPLLPIAPEPVRLLSSP